MKVKHGHDRKASQQNRYFMVDINPSEEIDVFSRMDATGKVGARFTWMCAEHIETISDISGLTFYISGANAR